MTIVELAKAARNERLSRLESLVDRVVDDAPIDTNEALALLQEVGWSPEEFDKAVKTRKRTRELKAIIDQMPGWRAEQTANTERYGVEIKAAVDEATAKARHVEELRCAYRTSDAAIQVKLNTGHAACRELQGLTADKYVPPTLHEQVSESFQQSSMITERR